MLGGKNIVFSNSPEKANRSITGVRISGLRKPALTLGKLMGDPHQCYLVEKDFAFLCK